MYPNKNPWSPWVSQHVAGTFAHPDAPDGGIGFGFSREVGPSGTDVYGGGTPDPHSPEGRDISPQQAAAHYALYEVERAMEQLSDARSTEDVLRVIEAAFGPKSFSEGFCQAQRRSPESQRFLELQKRFVLAELYDHLNGRVRWPLNAMDRLSFRGPALWQVGHCLPWAGYEATVCADRLKQPVEARAGWLKELTALFTQGDGALAAIKAQLKPEALEHWATYREHARRTPESGRSEAGAALGAVIVEVLLVIATLSKTAGFAAKLRGVVPQLLDLAVKLSSGRAGGAADEGAAANGGAKTTPAPKAPPVVVAPVASTAPMAEPTPTRDWEYAAKQSGRIEPGAIQTTPELEAAMDQSATRTAPKAPDGWPEMPDKAAQTFGADPVPKKYPPGTKLYRVIGDDGSGSGSFWSPDPPPSSEATWRGGSAVKDEWNGDGGFVQHTVGPEGLKAWSGPIAPQEAAVDGNVLPGGSEQIWVHRGTLAPDAPASSTPWNTTAIK